MNLRGHDRRNPDSSHSWQHKAVWREVHGTRSRTQDLGAGSTASMADATSRHSSRAKRDRGDAASSRRAGAANTRRAPDQTGAGAASTEERVEDTGAGRGAGAAAAAQSKPVKSVYVTSVTAAPSHERVKAAAQLKRGLCVTAVLQGCGTQARRGRVDSRVDTIVRGGHMQALMNATKQWLRSQAHGKDASAGSTSTQMTVGDVLDYWDGHAPHQLKTKDAQYVVDTCLRPGEAVEEADRFMLEREAR